MGLGVKSLVFHALLWGRVILTFVDRSAQEIRKTHYFQHLCFGFPFELSISKMFFEFHELPQMGRRTSNFIAQSGRIAKPAWRPRWGCTAFQEWGLSLQHLSHVGSSWQGLAAVASVTVAELLAVGKTHKLCLTCTTIGGMTLLHFIQKIIAYMRRLVFIYYLFFYLFVYFCSVFFLPLFQIPWTTDLCVITFIVDN